MLTKTARISSTNFLLAWESGIYIAFCLILERKSAVRENILNSYVFCTVLYPKWANYRLCTHIPVYGRNMVKIFRVNTVDGRKYYAVNLHIWGLDGTVGTGVLPVQPYRTNRIVRLRCAALVSGKLWNQRKLRETWIFFCVLLMMPSQPKILSSDCMAFYLLETVIIFDVQFFFEQGRSSRTSPLFSWVCPNY